MRTFGFGLKLRNRLFLHNITKILVSGPQPASRLEPPRHRRSRPLQPAPRIRGRGLWSGTQGSRGRNKWRRAPTCRYRRFGAFAQGTGAGVAAFSRVPPRDQANPAGRNVPRETTQVWRALHPVGGSSGWAAALGTWRRHRVAVFEVPPAAAPAPNGFAGDRRRRLRKVFHVEHYNWSSRRVAGGPTAFPYTGIAV